MKDLHSTGLILTNGILKIIDQQKLPQVEEWLTIENPEQAFAAIKALKVRGAPLIGVFAALALADFANTNENQEDIRNTAEYLRSSRPTAVNLMNALDRMLATDLSKEALREEAYHIFEEDVELCEKMAIAGAALVEDGDRILTHCNAGSIATVGLGTAIGVIIKAHQQGKNIHVYVDETRPLLQGGRLTAWEMKKHGIPYTLICDNMAASLMAEKKIDKIFVGSDRIAINGDFANKIGTYSVAVCAHYHGIPFYPVAPITTLDKECESGKMIPIELRKPEEVRGVEGHFGNICWAPEDALVYNPAFDVTPVDLVTGMIIDEHFFSQQQLKDGVLKTL